MVDIKIVFGSNRRTIALKVDDEVCEALRILVGYQVISVTKTMTRPELQKLWIKEVADYETTLGFDAWLVKEGG
jgi:hypothetical protein